MKLYSVRDHGAVGNGATDDTAAIQRAIDNAIDDDAASRRRAAIVPLAFFAIALLIAIVANLAGCGGIFGPSSSGPLPDPNAQKFVRCELGAVEQRVADGTVLALAAEALASGEYAKAIDALIEKIGVDSVRCAVQTISDVAGLPQFAPTPTTTPSTAASRRIDIAARAGEIQRAKGWR